jgi:hypothetical protein
MISKPDDIEVTPSTLFGLMTVRVCPKSVFSQGNF